MTRGARLTALAACSLIVTTRAAFAQDSGTPLEDLKEQAETASAATEQLILPIPLSNPTLGTGLAIAIVRIYEPENAGKPWVTGAGAMYTSNDDRALAAFHNMSLDHDRFRFSALGGYASLPLRFYGVGAEAGDRGIAINIQQDVLGGRFEGLARVGKDFYAGVRLRLQNVKTRIRTDPDETLPIEIPTVELESTIVSLGPSIILDRTDAPFNPRNGLLVEAHWMVGLPFLGSDFNYSAVAASANVYRALNDQTALAGRISICAAGQDAPYYDLCNYGQSNDLRGYLNGQYRDHASWAAQVELRQRLWGRIGGVAFAGIGGIAPSLGRVGDSTLLPAGGVGLRYQLSKQYGINARVDVAFGKNSHAIYFAVGEAF